MLRRQVFVLTMELETVPVFYGSTGGAQFSKG